ncbi:MAG: hypothetical protein ACR2ND_12400 [Solirubrobacteraceae bacterium]
MANMRGDLPLQVSVDDGPCQAHSTYSWAGGGMVLTISTVLPERGFAVELISTYVGHPQTSTIATHLMLGPVGRAAEIHTVDHDPEHLNPVERARECAYDHAHHLIESLGGAGHQVGVQLDEQTFAELERVE